MRRRNYYSERTWRAKGDVLEKKILTLTILKYKIAKKMVG
jgi:hypothetical protein